MDSKLGVVSLTKTTYIFTGDSMEKILSVEDPTKKLTLNLATSYNMGLLSNYSGSQTLLLNLGIF